MALSYIADATGHSAVANDGSATVNVPAGTLNGDLMLLFMTTSADTAITTPTGWTLIGTMQVRTGELAGAYYRVAVSEPASYTFTDTGSTISAVIHTLRGQAASPIDATAAVGAQVTSGTTVTANSVTTATDNAWLITWFVDRGTCTFSTPTGMDERSDFGDGLGVYSQSVDTQLIAAAGATGTRASTTSATIATAARAMSFAIASAVVITVAPAAASLATSPKTPTLALRIPVPSAAALVVTGKNASLKSTIKPAAAALVITMWSPTRFFSTLHIRYAAYAPPPRIRITYADVESIAASYAAPAAVKVRI